jgi:hypothetical protein
MDGLDPERLARSQPVDRIAAASPIDGIHRDGSVVPVTRGDEFVLRD